MHGQQNINIFNIVVSWVSWRQLRTVHSRTFWV